jgi:CelD/BcsL family acetyltransferase involved in cellulose biosynthesis
MPFRIEEAHGIDAFLQLESVWNACCHEAGNDSFFLSHAWFRCCLEGLSEGVEPLALLVRDGAAVIGIVPLLSQKTSWRIFPARLLALMQNQDAPFADIVLPRTQAVGVLAAALEHLSQRSRWDLCSAAKIDRASRTSQILANCLLGQAHLRLPGGCSPVLDMDRDWQAFWKAQSQRFKKTVRNVANRVEALGSIEIVDLAASESATECLDAFRAVAARSWKASLPVSVTRNAGIARFFAALTSTLHRRGQLSLWVLRLDGVPIATEYHVRDGGTVYALRSDFDDQYREASPGAHLNGFIVRRYFEEGGVRVYDMGPGESAYKQRWANRSKEFDSFWLFKHSPYGRALYNVERRAVPPLRRARDWWRKDTVVSSSANRA